MDFSGQTLKDKVEVVDGNRYDNCRFENCQMVFRGGEIPTITSCHFENCGWQFEDAAERTLIFMRDLYHGMGQGGRELIDATLEALRRPTDAPGGGQLGA